MRYVARDEADYFVGGYRAEHMEYDFIKEWADDIRQHAAYRGKANFIQIAFHCLPIS